MYVCMYGWMDVWMDGWVCMAGWISLENLKIASCQNFHENVLLETIWGRFLLRRVGGYTGRSRGKLLCMYGWMDGCMYGWMYGCMDGCMYGCMYV